MAMTAANVTIEDIWSEGNTNGRKFKCVKAILAITADGGTTGDIPAALFGMTKINRVTNSVGSDDKQYLLAPSYDGSQIYAHTAVGGAPADITATVRVVVIGQ